MSTNVTLHAGHDVAYFTSGQGPRRLRRGHVVLHRGRGTARRVGREGRRGARAERPGRPGRDRAASTSRTSGPAGNSWSSAASPRPADEREEAAVAAYLAAHPYASAVELAEVRAAERGKDPHRCRIST